MQEMLFNPAIWMPAAGLAAALAVFIYGNNRVNSSTRNAGIALAGVVVAWMVVAYFVQTPVERCVARTRAILASVESADWATLRTLLDDSTALESLLGRERIAAATERAATGYQLKSIRVLSTEAIPGPGTVDVGLTALLEGIGTVTSAWRFEFDARPTGIVLRHIVPVTIGPASTDQIRRSLGVR